jgi:sugar lactone lactonase YvrE
MADLLSSMKTPSLFFLVLAVCTMVAFAAKPATTAGVSTSGAVAWSVDPENGELNLVRASGQGGPVKLCDTVSTANLGVHFSPDDKYVMITDGSASVGIHVTLYQRSSGLSYRAVDFDFDLAAQKLAMEAETGKKIDDTVLDRSYLRCLGWSRDGQWAILQLSGSGKLDGKRVEIASFQCAYNPAKGGMTNDRRVMK